MIEGYIANFEGITNQRLNEIYKIIKQIAPAANEKISYGVPTFYNDNGPIVYFAGYKGFVSIYPVHFAPEIADLVKPYLSGKSTARFSNEEDLPESIIKQIVIALVRRNQNSLKK